MPLVLVAFVVASVVAVPILALIGATVVTLGPVLGFVSRAVGTLLAASATFGVGRLIGRKPLSAGSAPGSTRSSNGSRSAASSRSR